MVGYIGIFGWKMFDEEMCVGVEELLEFLVKYLIKEVLIGVDVDFFFVGWNYGMKVGGEVIFEIFVFFGIDVYELIESCIYISEKGKVSMDDMYNDILNFGVIFDVKDKVVFLVDSYKVELVEFIGFLEIGDELLCVFVYDFGEDILFIVGFYVMLIVLIEVVGGINIMNDFEKSWGIVMWEVVVECNLEVVVIVNYGNVIVVEKCVFMMNNFVFVDLDVVKNDWFVILEYVEVILGLCNINVVKKLVDGFWSN